MKPAYAGSIAIILALFVSALHADEPTAQPAVPPSLEGVTWAGPGVALGDLRGKSVVILVYVTKYQLAVDWPTQLLAELKLAAEGKPVVILAINTDKTADLDLAYMNARAFNGPNILHGRDPLLPARLGLASAFFRYVWIDPQGRVVKSGNAGDRFSDGQEPRFALPRKIARSADLGDFEIVDGQMPAKLTRTLWPYELGRLPSAADLQKLRTGLDDEEQKVLDAAFDRYLDAEVKRIRAAAAGPAEERLWSFERAKRLYTTFRSKPQAGQFKEVGATLPGRGVQEGIGGQAGL